MNRQQLLMWLTWHLGVFAIAVACLIGIGRGSYEIPILVAICVVTSWLITDGLQWLELPRFVAYIAMISGSAWAMIGYTQQAGTEQLFPVANLLVFAQLPLFFQKKSQRIFEQLGVFLILELVVAALVNEDLVFGMLLIPTLALGAASLMLYAHYWTAQQSGIATRHGLHWWTEFRSWLRIWSGASAGGNPPIALMTPGEEAYLPSRSRLAWVVEALPLTLSIFAFGAAYFYFLPRLHSGSYNRNGMGQPQVGFSDVLTIDQVGRLLLSRREVLRLQLLTPTTMEPVKPLLSPYLTGAVLSHYTPSYDRGYWRATEHDSNGRPRKLDRASRLPRWDDIAQGFRNNHRPLIARIVEHGSLGAHVMSLAPFTKGEGIDSFEFDRLSWTMSNRNHDILEVESSRRYETIAAFEPTGNQTSLIPNYDDFLGTYSDDSLFQARDDGITPEYRAELTRFSPHRFRTLLEVRDEALAAVQDMNNLVEQAQVLQRYLAFSGRFKYTLDLTMPRSKALDPIEDFVRNHKQGHCQYFASTLVMMLRSLGIPARMVVGYRPSDYNEVGDYFLVREMHAHTWVEAYFTREEFQGSTRELPPEYRRGAWLRLDPTPAVSGSNANASIRTPGGQSLDFASQLWRDYVMNLDRKSQEDVVRGLTSSDAVNQDYVKSIKEFINGLLNWETEWNFRSPRDWFSWRSAVLVILIGFPFVLSRRLLPWSYFWGWLPRWSTMQIRPRSSRPPVLFYQRISRLLERLGWPRQPSVTPHEWSKSMHAWLQQQDPTQATAQALQATTDLYYDVRFGGKENLTKEELELVRKTILAVKKLHK